MAEAGGFVAFRRTDDGGWMMGGTRHWRGSAEYTETGGEGEYRKKRERRQARYSCRSKEPG